MDIVVWLRSLGPVRPSRPFARPPEHPRNPTWGGGVAAAGLLGRQEDPRAEIVLKLQQNRVPCRKSAALSDFRLSSRAGRSSRCIERGRFFCKNQTQPASTT